MDPTILNKMASIFWHKHHFLPPSVARPSPKPPLLPIAIIVAVTLAGLIALAFPVAARMTRRLDNLAQVARRFGTGDLEQRADTSGRDEVSETAKAFNAMAQSISLSRRRERELLANVSHELRTPMARMQVLLELTQTKPDAAQRYVEELGRDFLELQQLLDTIIDTLRCDPFHTNEHAPWPMQPQETSLSRFLGEIAADFQARVPMRELVFQLPATDVLVQADHTLLRRALLNLLVILPALYFYLRSE